MHLRGATSKQAKTFTIAGRIVLVSLSRDTDDKLYFACATVKKLIIMHSNMISLHASIREAHIMNKKKMLQISFYNTNKGRLPW